MGRDLNATANQSQIVQEKKTNAVASIMDVFIIHHQNKKVIEREKNGGAGEKTSCKR